MTLVAAKKRCNGTRKVPLKKNSPTATAAAIPTIVPIQGHGHAQAERRRRRYAVPHETHQAPAAGAGKIDENNADDQRSFNAFTKCDEKSREHKNSSC